MNNLVPIEFKNQRIILTEFLAESFGTERKIISNNFNRNIDRFIEGKHYYKLEGEELKAFKGIHQNDESLKFVSVLYLWTERGAARHAKILDTDEAWEVYEQLEETYFRVKETRRLTTEEMLELQFNFTKEVKAEVKEVKDKVTVIQEFVDATELSTADSKRLTSLANKIVVTLLGGKKSKAYETLSKKAFSDLYKQLHREFGVSSIAEIKKKDVELAKEVIQNYKAPIVLQDEIEKANNQINFEGVV